MYITERIAMFTVNNCLCIELLINYQIISTMLSPDKLKSQLKYFCELTFSRESLTLGLASIYSLMCNCNVNIVDRISHETKRSHIPRNQKVTCEVPLSLSIQCGHMFHGFPLQMFLSFFLFTIHSEGSRAIQKRHVACHSINTSKPHDFQLNALRAS